MVTRPARRHGGWLTADAMTSLALIAVAALPLAFSFEGEFRACRTEYQTMVAMEIVDGEMEFLAAGEWQAFAEGTHPYPVRASAATNLPPGRFLLTRTPQSIRIEWKPDGKKSSIFRERRLP